MKPVVSSYALDRKSEPLLGDDDEEWDNLPRSTKWYRRHGRQSRRQKAVKQQYLTPQEERAFVDYALHMDRVGKPLTVQSMRYIAMTITRQRSSTFQIPGAEDTVRLPGKNWPQALLKRHPELKTKRVKAIDWKRDDPNIYEKVEDWFSAISKELQQPAILQENVYNMDETGVLLSSLKSLKVLVSSHELRNYRGSGEQRTLITAIECVSADGRFLHPLIIWPAASHRSNWTAHPTPGWHFACTKSGYTDSVISLYWIQHVFDPLTRDRANGKPRILINDGFGTHESLEVLKFCFENNIILCRLPSHTSHKLQPCDISVFGPLKTAYRQQVEQLYRGGANTIGKQHFTLLYRRAREAAFTPRNIRSGWSKAGIFPLNPERVLRNMKKPVPAQLSLQCDDSNQFLHPDPMPPQTPTTSASFNVLRSKFESSVGVLDETSKLHFQKLAHAAEKAFADRAILFDENKNLTDQNNEKNVRDSMRRTVVGKAKIMSYNDIVEAKKRREERDAGPARAPRRRVNNALGARTAKQIQPNEVDNATREIWEMRLSSYCSILEF